MELCFEVTPVNSTEQGRFNYGLVNAFSRPKISQVASLISPDAAGLEMGIK